MRLFIATTFPPDVLCGLNERVGRVKTRLPPCSWVRPESQHLTFAFLGEQDEALIPKLACAVETRLRGIHAFDAQLRGCGFFPNSRNARVAWVGVTPDEKFNAVAAVVRAAVTAAGVELDAPTSGLTSRCAAFETGGHRRVWRSTGRRSVSSNRLCSRSTA